MRTLSDFNILGRVKEVARFIKNGGADVVVQYHDFDGYLFLDVIIESRDRFRPGGGPLVRQWIGVREERITDFFAAIEKARELFDSGNIFDEPAPGTDAVRQFFKE